MVDNSGHKRKRQEGQPTTLRYADEYDALGSIFRLIQVPSDSTMESLEAALGDGSVCIVGDEKGPAKLITADTTYSMTRVETSNAVLILPPLSETAADASEEQILASASYALHLDKEFPKYDSLRTLLSEHVHTFNEAGGWPFSTLLDRVIMSPAELQKGLKDLGAMELDGRWAFVDPTLQDAVLDGVFSVIIEKDMSLSRVAVNSVADTLREDGVDPRFAVHCLAQCAAQESSDVTLTSEIELNFERMAALRAQQLFRQHLRRSERDLWPIKDFLDNWATSLPGVDAPSAEILRGIAIRESELLEGNEVECYRYIPESELPSEPRSRLEALFAIKHKWGLDELQPYLEPLCNAQTKMADILLKHTRASTDAAGVRVHSAGWV